MNWEEVKKENARKAKLKEQKAIETKRKRKQKSLISKVCRDCSVVGIITVGYKLEMLKGNKGLKLSVSEINYKTTIECFEKGIEKYKEKLDAKNKP